MINPSIMPKGEAIRHAVRWLAEEGSCTREHVEQAGVRFDLSPLEEEFLLKYFVTVGSIADQHLSINDESTRDPKR